VIDLAGAIDLHVHSAPDVYPRSLSDLQVAQAAEAAGMRAVLLKSHHTLTADRATLVRQHVGIAVHGGLALNLSVGGINPVAVETAIALGARQIWMPTIHARNALRNAVGARFEKEAARGYAGLVAFDEAGDPVGGLLPILEMVRDAGIALGTGHLAPEESLSLLRLARDLGLRHVLVTHPMMSFTRLSIGQMTRAVELGGYLEFVALSCHPSWPGSMPAAAVAEAIHEVGVRACVLASDGGQASNATAPDMLRTFALELGEAGLEPNDLRRMMSDNPAYLLGL
jgi:hypothetical protein